MALSVLAGPAGARAENAAAPAAAPVASAQSNAADAPSAAAFADGGRRILGFGHFYNNDLIGDQHDRWQTMGYSVSILQGTGWSGTLPAHPFDLMEYRFGVSVITPANLRHPNPDDRRYVGRLEASAHTHFALAQQYEAELGLGLVATGPGTGVGEANDYIHRLISAPRPYVRDEQLGNHLYPFITTEVGRPIALGEAQLRPFVDARAGDESLVRAGVDFTFGAPEQGALWLRDTTTGQRYVGISGTGYQGTSFVLGGDVAHVFDSVYMPSGGVTEEPTRYRLRAGVSTLMPGGIGLFYGLTWLSREFIDQPEGQMLGSVRFRLAF